MPSVPVRIGSAGKGTGDASYLDLAGGLPHQEVAGEGGAGGAACMSHTAGIGASANKKHG